MPGKKSKWIQKAIKKPGSLTEFAKRHRLMNKDGTVDLDRTERYINKNLKGKEKTRRLRQVNLARTLRKMKN